VRHRGIWCAQDFDYVCDTTCPLCAQIRAHAKAEGAAEERERLKAGWEAATASDKKAQHDCEKALLEMEESATLRERERVLRQVWFELKAALGKGEPQQILNKTIDAIRARGAKP
jgi:hypothetical protein